MADETPGDAGTVTDLDDAKAAKAARDREEVNPSPKGSTGRKSGGTKKAAGTRKAPARKATGVKKAAAKKAAGTGVVRSKSTVSKEGTQKDQFTGETLPVTSFPTVRQSDGSYARGPVARKNLEAWRADKKAKRTAEKAAAAKKAPAKKAGGRKAAAKKANA